MIATTVGIPLPRDVRNVLEKAQGGLQVGEMVPPEAFHVVLANLGEHMDPVVGQVRQKLAAVQTGPFYLTISGLGTLGGNEPQAVHAEVEPAAGLKTLHKMVGRAIRLAGVDLPHERYTPHVTLARFRQLAQHDLKQIMSFLSRRQSLNAGPFPVTEFALYGTRIAEPQSAPELLETYPLSGG